MYQRTFSRARARRTPRAPRCFRACTQSRSGDADYDGPDTGKDDGDNGSDADEDDAAEDEGGRGG